MIEELRRKFIGLSMLAVLIALLLIMFCINRFAYTTNTTNADLILSLIAENDGKVPDTVPEEYKGIIGDFDGTEARINFDQQYTEAERLKAFSNITDESLRQARYFTVQINSQGMITSVNTEYSSVSYDDAVTIATSVAKVGKTNAYFVPYRYLASKNMYGTMYIFLDCSSDLSTLYYLIIFSIGFSFIILLIVFLIIYLTSKKMVKPIAESYDKQKQFITNAGHELKTPLSIINSCTDVIEMENGEDKWTAGIHEQIGRLTMMTNQLVMLAKMQESAAKIEKRGINISKVAEKTFEGFRVLAEDKGYTLHVFADPDIYLYANEQMITQLCSILADNALKYATPNTEINLGVKRKNRRIFIFSDNAAENTTKGTHKELFDRFYRGDESHNSEKKGYGIGLSMLQTIAEAHGGKATAYSEDGNRILIAAAFPDKRIKPVETDEYANVE